MEKADLTKLYEAQAKLDETIAVNHHVTYESTRARRILALLVEIGEFANTTRCFKYWSNKGMEDKDIVLDEYADGMHFFLSLGIDIKVKDVIYEINKPDNDLTDQIHQVYSLIERFKENPDEETYRNAFTSFLDILPLLNFPYSEAEKAYFKKLGVNYNRQDNNY